MSHCSTAPEVLTKALNEVMVPVPTLETLEVTFDHAVVKLGLYQIWPPLMRYCSTMPFLTNDLNPVIVPVPTLETVEVTFSNAGLKLYVIIHCVPDGQA